MSNLKFLKNFIKHSICLLPLVVFIVMSVFYTGGMAQRTPGNVANAVMTYKMRPNYKDSIVKYDMKMDSIRALLVDDVDAYITRIAKRSRMSAEHIVDKCLEYGYDIPLLLAQANQETKFATCGSNNAFGIGHRRYSHPDKSVDDYIALMQKYYIVNRTPEQLIKANFRMEFNRKYKYAGDSTYGSRIGSIRNKIMTTTDIDNLYEEYNILKTVKENFIINENRHLDRIRRDSMRDNKESSNF